MKIKVIGLIGGSGLYEPSFFGKAIQKTVKTPFGSPSDKLWIGEFENARIVFIPRHGRKHSIPANRVNHEANLWALKKEKVTHIMTTSSSGSLRKDIRPGYFVVPDDFLCFWNIPTVRKDVHHPTPSLDTELRSTLIKAAKKLGIKTVAKGTYIQTMGPRLETKAEIRFFKNFGDILGMTMASEATIACELGIKYASLCSVDNYCNGIVPISLTYQQIVRQQKENSVMIASIIKTTMEMLV